MKLTRNVISAMALLCLLGLIVYSIIANLASPINNNGTVAKASSFDRIEDTIEEELDKTPMGKDLRNLYGSS